MEKLHLLDKLLRELDDVRNTETSLVKKLGQIEAENINLSNKILDQQLPEVFELIDNALTKTNELYTAFEEDRNNFSSKNNLDQVIETN